MDEVEQASKKVDKLLDWKKINTKNCRQICASPAGALNWGADEGSFLDISFYDFTVSCIGRGVDWSDNARTTAMS